jgi:hypothetical protein
MSMRLNSTGYRYFLILVTGVTAGLLLALSWPRLHASVRYLPVDTAISNYWKTREFDVSQLAGLIERAEETIAIHDHYRYFEGLSELQILNSQDMSQTIWLRREALEASIEAAEQALLRAPAKPRTWLRIARAREYLAHPPETVIPPLKMSILTGRFEPTLMLSRLELGFRYLPSLDAKDIPLLRDQAVLTWQTQQRPMLERINSGTLNIGLLREVLVDGNQGVLSEMEVQLAK